MTLVKNDFIEKILKDLFDLDLDSEKDCIDFILKFGFEKDASISSGHVEIYRNPKSKFVIQYTSCFGLLCACNEKNNYVIYNDLASEEDKNDYINIALILYGDVIDA